MNLSFDPNQPFAGVNFGLDNVYDSQAKGAELAKYMTDEQFKNIIALQDPSTSLAYQKAAAGISNPSLTTQVNARTVPEGIMKGISAGIGNIQEMAQANRQRQAYRDIATQQQAYQQKQLQMAQHQIQADQQRRMKGGNVISPRLRDIYNTLDAAGQNKFLADDAAKRMGVVYTPIESQAKSEAAQLERTAKEKQFQAMAGMTLPEFMALANTQQITPQLQNIYNYTIGGTAPTDLVDYQERDAGLKSKQEGLYTQQLNNDVLPEVNKAKLDAQLLSNRGVELQNALKKLELEAAPEKLGAEADARQWTQKERERKTAEAEKIRQIVYGVNTLLDNGTLTPQELVTAQTQLKLLGSNALDPIVSGFQSVGRLDGTAKVTRATENVNTMAKDKQKQLESQGFKKSPSGKWYNPTTGEWR